MAQSRQDKRPFELAPFLLRYAPLAFIVVIVVAIGWRRWSPVSVEGLPPTFNLTCTGTIATFINNVPQGSPSEWKPAYHVDLPHRRVDDVYTGKHIRIGSVDTEHAALWVEDSDNKQGRNVVSYFYHENRLAGSLTNDLPNDDRAELKKATCVRTPG